jgi:hypothetical protein
VEELLKVVTEKFMKISDELKEIEDKFMQIIHDRFSKLLGKIDFR